jgi:hypothetical protein
VNSLRSQYSDGLEHVQDSLVLHSFEDDAQRDEDSSSSHSGCLIMWEGGRLEQ